MWFFHPPAISAMLDTPISVLSRYQDIITSDLPIHTTDISCYECHKDTPKEYPEIATVPDFSGLNRQSIFWGVLYTEKKVARHHPKYRQGDHLPNNPGQHDIAAHITSFGCFSCCRKPTTSALENQRNGIAGDKEVGIPLRPQCGVLLPQNVHCMLQREVYSCRPESGCQCQSANLRLKAGGWIWVPVQQYTTKIACFFYQYSPGQSPVILIEFQFDLPITSVEEPRITAILKDQSRHLIIWPSCIREQAPNIKQNSTLNTRSGA